MIETSSPSGLFIFVFELAHMALNSLHPVSGIIKRPFFIVSVWKNFAMHFCSYLRRSSQRCLAA